MSANSPSRFCPRCGHALPEDAPEGLCPRCLGALHFATETLLPGDIARTSLPSLTPNELAPYFPQLEILECLGRGGMGVVYKARQKSLNRLVALKLLAPERADDPQFAERFEKEARALAALNHPNIVSIYDFGRVDTFTGSPPSALRVPLCYLLMEFVDGVNLRALLCTKKLTPEEALSIVPPVCDALQCAHDHGIVHRDIKPENLLIDKSGIVKIADFGIAKMLGEESPTGVAESEGAGTPDYAAPEQSNGNADHRVDIYSLGVVLYEMLTGERPKDKIEAPSMRVQVDIRIDEIVLRALEKEPEMRFATAAEFRTRVEAVNQTGRTNPLHRTKGALLDPRVRWSLFFVSLLSLGVIGLGLVVYTTRSFRQSSETVASHDAARTIASTVPNPLESEIIRLAGERLEHIRAAYQAGRASLIDLDQAEGEFAIAEARGDPVKQAEARLRSATFTLEHAEKLFQTGRMSRDEYDLAKQRKREAQLEFQLVQRMNSVQQNSKQADLAGREAVLATGVAFGPVIERVLSLPVAGMENSFLDFESGNFMSAPNDVVEEVNKRFRPETVGVGFDERTKLWVDRTGADLMLGSTEPRISLVLHGGWVELTNVSFTKARPDELLAMAVESSRKHAPGMSPLPFTRFEQPKLDEDGAALPVLFQTREGSTGLLQVVGFADDGNHVKIRYKLIPSRTAEDPSAMTRTFPLRHMAANDMMNQLRLYFPKSRDCLISASLDSSQVSITAPPSWMTRIETFITVMDWPDAIQLRPGYEYPRDTVMHRVRSFFYACAIEDASEAIDRLLSPEVLAMLKHDTKSPEFINYQMGGVPDAAWEKSLHADWPGKKEVIRRFIREWNRYPLKRITEDPGVAIGFGMRYSCTVAFEGAPKSSYTVTILPVRVSGGTQEDSFLFSSLPPWWERDKTNPTPSNPAAEPSPLVDVDLKIIELPDGAAISPAQNDVVEIQKITGADVYSVPKITTSSGEECEITTAGVAATDGLAPTPQGLMGRVRPILDGNTVHYSFKFSLCTPFLALDAGRTLVQEIARNGDAQLGQPLILDLGIGEKGHRYLVWMIFNRGQAACLPASPQAKDR